VAVLPPGMRFSEELRKLIKRNTREQPYVVHRREVEGIGRSLDMLEAEACSAFFGLRGVLWDVRTGNLARSLRKATTEAPELSRQWTAVNDIVLLSSPLE
jgi:hypothetical protein